MNVKPHLPLLIALLTLSACDDGGAAASGDAVDPPTRDAAPQVEPYWDQGGPPNPDAGPSPDAAQPDPDAARPDPDASRPDPDASRPDPDASRPDPDASQPDFDAARPDPDAARPDPDAARPDPDAARPDPDALQPDPDASRPDPDAALVECEDDPLSLLENGGFEAWEGEAPIGFVGEETNLYAFEPGPARCGAHGLRLMNEEDRHGRFTSAPISATAGRYTLIYWARGGGEIRNAFHDGDFSTYSGYTRLLGGDWRQIIYSFNLADDAAALEIIFSVHLTEPAEGDVIIDDVILRREVGVCDAVVCPDWAACDRATGACAPLSGHCGDDSDCREYMACDADHLCALRPGRCERVADCDGETPVCDVAAHTCVAGDPCLDVSCAAWERCAPETATCVLDEGRCRQTPDCTQALPACDVSDHRCVDIDHPANVVLNGGFERWDMYDIAFHGENWLPDAWFGLDFGTDNTGDTEIDPRDVREGMPHSGLLGVQLIGGEVADRFTSEGFDVPAGTYRCAYWVRGQGSIRQRSYSSSGWHPLTDWVEVNSQEWLQIPFDIRGGSRGMRIIFYPSRTAGEHLHVDDVACTRVN
ncbi:invertase recombinase-like protein [Myxococcota bacterium]|nr:invertase recombinase-like protein [Myxococcota bacterium]